MFMHSAREDITEACRQSRLLLRDNATTKDSQDTLIDLTTERCRRKYIKHATG